MCLAIPHVIRELLDDKRAEAFAGPVRTEIRTDLIENAAPGDIVLVHAGFAIERVDPSESEELLALWEEVRRLAGEPDEGGRRDAV